MAFDKSTDSLPGPENALSHFASVSFVLIHCLLQSPWIAEYRTYG
jgi:hypothetical protein